MSGILWFILIVSVVIILLFGWNEFKEIVTELIDTIFSSIDAGIEKSENQ